MTDPVLAATTADVRKRCDELEKALARLTAVFPPPGSEDEAEALEQARTVLHG